MKLMFHKIEKYGKWIGREFESAENINDFTEKIPPNNGYQWNENLNDWELIPVVIEDINDIETENIESGN